MEIIKNNKYKIVTAITFLGSVLSILSFNPSMVLGNPTNFPVHSNCSLSTASTSPVYLSTSGTTVATGSPLVSKELVCDAYNLDPLVPNPTAIDTASLLVQFTGSSTAAVLNAYVLHSLDGVDYYAETDATSSPSLLQDLAPRKILSLAFASSTAGNLGTTTPNRIVDVKTPVRYLKILFTLPTGSTNGSVYAELVPKKQVR